MEIEAFWKRIKLAIKEKRLTQDAVSRACGISPGTFRMWMSRGRIPPLSYAYNLSRCLGVSLEYLISGMGTDKLSRTNAEILALLNKASEKLKKII